MPKYITYKQADSRWGKKNYNGSSTMATAGCGPTSVAMLAYAVDGKTNPWDVALFMKKNGYAIRNNGTAWAGIPAAMKHFGLKDVKKVNVDKSMTEVWEYMKKGYCAVFLFRAGSRGGVCWTTAGHYIAVTDYKYKDKKHYLYTRDSGGRNHTGWYAYETTMRGLIPQVWVGKVGGSKPTPKPAPKPKEDDMAKYKAALPKVPARGYFAKGDKGEEVKKMQKAVNWANGGSIVTPLKVDGIVGPLTIQAVSFLEEIHHMSIDGHFGPKCRKLIASMELTGAIKACNWAVSVSKDNRFSYGAGQRAHRCGCYFCGTNTGPNKKNKDRKGEAHVVYDKKGNAHNYSMTYCCNTFATAAYAHGAKDAGILKVCKGCGALDFKPSQWTKHNFKLIGTCKNVAFDKLKAGDVILSDQSKGAKFGHVWMYLGADRYVEATSLGGGDKSWTADSIKSKPGAKANYNKYYAKYNGTNVVRYTK